jgi:ribonuclease BN (tRNA processing enzyme)
MDQASSAKEAGVANATTPVRAQGGPPPLAPAYVHGQDFSVITIGTSSPELSFLRASSCTMIQYKGKYYTVDAGTGSVYGFMKAPPDENGTTQYAYRDIRAMFFSHLHQDHTTNYFDIATIRWMTGGKDMLRAGPPHTGGLHEFLTAFWKDDLSYRMLRRITQQNLVGEAVATAGVGMFSGVTVEEITGPRTFEYDGLTIETAEMTHTMYNLAYRFDVDGKSIVISGDTAHDPDLIALAKNVDILVLDCDAFIPGGSQPALDPTKLPDGYQPVGRYGGAFNVGTHMNLGDVAKVLAAAQPKVCVATHLTPGPKDPTALLVAAQTLGYKGTIEIAADGKEYFPR